MAYVAIARKWRPQKFEDLVGQEHVVQTLKNSISEKRVSHAYLFSGPRGVGKTTVARVFAKALRCPNAKDAIPCNHCEECLAIAEGRAVDVAEIDGASNNGVESVRAIRENVGYSPSFGSYKIYIIDEVHMLSISAFNALLKTLEEPPPHVVFLFATTEVQKLPMTILSRCLRFEFRRLSQNEIVERLKVILNTEGYQIVEGGLRLIAAYSDGSLRDALSLLDQVLSHSALNKDEPISEPQVVAALGVSPEHAATQYLTFIIEKKIFESLELISTTYSSGVDLKHFAERCLDETRLLYLLTLARVENHPLTANELDISQPHWELIQKNALKTDVVQVERMAQILSKAIQQMSWAGLPRLVFEMASVRMTQLEELGRVEKSLFSKRPTPTEVAPSQPTLASASPVPMPSASLVEIRQPEPSAYSPTMPMTKAQPQWNGFVDMVMKKRPLLGALLCHAEFRLEADQKVVLTFESKSFYERQAQDSRNRTEIEAFVKSFFGPQAQLLLSASEGQPLQSIEKSKQEHADHLKKQALEHPSVLQFQKVLGAELVDIKVEV